MITIVRYTVESEMAEENAALVRAVFAELGELEPSGFRYMTFQLADEVSFVHVAIGGGNASPPLPALPAFRHFQKGLGDRSMRPPDVSTATIIGGFGFSGDSF